MHSKSVATTLALVLSLGLAGCGTAAPAASTEGGAESTASAPEDVVYDLYRAHGDRWCHLGDTVTFEAKVVEYLEAEAIGDAGEENVTPADVDLSQFAFQWYYCQHIAETGEIVYVPIEGANDLSYTIDRVTEVNLYDNDELEYLLAMFPADATDLSYGSRSNISSIWFCLSAMPEYVEANKAHGVVLDPEGTTTEGDVVAFATDRTGTFEVKLSDVAETEGPVCLYMATIHDGAVVAEDELEVDGSFTYEFDAVNSYMLNWYTDAEEPVSFTYEIVGDAGEPYWFSASELEPSDAGLNVYVDALTIRSDGEYQLTVENPWLDADYASSDEGVATVSDDGKIWAVAPGEATITVTQGGETAEVVVTVVE